MATYKEIKGTQIEVLASDPSNPVEGQVWYNSTSNVLKGSNVMRKMGPETYEVFEKAGITKAQIAKIVDLPGPYTIGQLNFVNAAAGGINANQLNSANGNGVLTITGNGVNQPLQVNKFQQAATFNIPIIFDSNGALTNTFRQAQGQQNLVFAQSFTVKDQIIFTALNNSSQLNFNHSLVSNS